MHWEVWNSSITFKYKYNQSMRQQNNSQGFWLNLGHSWPLNSACPFYFEMKLCSSLSFTHICILRTMCLFEVYQVIKITHPFHCQRKDAVKLKHSLRSDGIAFQFWAIFQFYWKNLYPLKLQYFPMRKKWSKWGSFYFVHKDETKWLFNDQAIIHTRLLKMFVHI